MLRFALTLALLLAAAPAFAGEEAFPAEGDRWQMDVQVPSGGGQARFARIIAEPYRRGGWATVIRCGTVDVRTGREVVTLRADGVAGRARGGWMGGTYRSAASPTGTSGFAFLTQDGLDVDVAIEPPCPCGRGALSSGD